MVTAPLTELSIKYTSVVYVDGHIMLKTVRGAANINY
jgi:hypothetical protein